MSKQTLQERINKISEYFRGMEMTNGVLIIKVSYKDKWGVFPSNDEKIKVAKSEDSINEYFYYGDFYEISFDDIFDLIDNTIEMNLSAAAKIQLLSEKFEELKILFASESLQKLQTLKFTFDEKVISKPKRKYTKRKKTENTMEETSNVETEQKETIEEQ